MSGRPWQTVSGGRLVAAVSTLVAAVALAAAAAPAAAGDYADRDIIGFSADGAYFAFEEYGVQDGSGFAYSNIYVIDTIDDSWVSGTPIRVMPENEDITLATARADARSRAQPVLQTYRIGAPGEMLVVNPATELSADPYVVRFVSSLYQRYDEHTWAVSLEELPFADPEGCENLGPTVGYRLTLTNVAAGQRVIHEDATIPGSRGCPQAYAISDVIGFRLDTIDPVLVVLVGVISQGFEGPDRRFLAVTGPLTAEAPPERRPLP